MEIETTEQLEELLASIVLNRGNFSPSEIIDALSEVCWTNSRDSNLNKKRWKQAVKILDEAFNSLNELEL